MSETTGYALNNNWLGDSSAMVGNLTSGSFTTSNCIQTTGYAPSYSCYQSTWYYPVYYSLPARPIKLAMSEVERLRKAAKADPKLKDILQKFTDQIEIIVDFD